MYRCILVVDTDRFVGSSYGCEISIAPKSKTKNTKESSDPSKAKRGEEEDHVGGEEQGGFILRVRFSLTVCCHRDARAYI